MTFDSREQSVYDAQPVECFRFALGNVLYLWTSAEKSIVLPHGTFTPLAGLSASEVEYSEEEISGGLEIKLPASAPVVTPFVPYVPGVAMLVTVYVAHRGEESAAQPRFVGVVSSATLRDSEATLVCLPLSEALKRRIPSLTYQPLCNWALYGPGCGVLAALFTDTATVLSASGVTVTSSAFAARPDNWFRGGWLEDPTSGDIRFIVAHVGNTVTLMNPFPALVIGQTVKAVAGCDRTEATCIAKFDNFVNFLGFPRMPTRNLFVGQVG